MAHVLGDYIGKICLCYLYDVIIFGTTQKELLDRLGLVHQRLHEFCLKVKPSKCVLLERKLNFWDTWLTQQWCSPYLTKFQQSPHCLRDVRAFYGLVGYYRRFIAGFATIAKPLTRLTRKGTKFVRSS